MDTIEHASQLIAAAYESGPIDALPSSAQPRNFDEAYAVQDRVARSKGWQRAGWKAGLTSVATREKWAIDSPVVAGQLFTHAVYPSPCERTAGASVIVEAEYAVRVAADVPLRSLPYTAEDMSEFVESVAPSIEVVASRFHPTAPPELFSSVADNSSHGWLVLGAPLADWKSLDLRAQKVDLTVDGTTAAEGKGADILGHPLEVVAWFANHCASRGAPLKAGEVIATGACAKTTLKGPCDIVADFGPLGRATLKLK